MDLHILKSLDTEISMELVTDKEELRKIYSNPITHESAYGEEFIDTEEIGIGYNHMVFYTSDGNIVGSVPFKQVNRLMAEIHIHMMPQYWNTGVSLLIANKMCLWLKNNTTYLKVLSWASDAHDRTQGYIDKLGFKIIGKVPQSCLYRGQVCDTKLYYADLYDNKLVGDI